MDEQRNELDDLIKRRAIVYRALDQNDKTLTLRYASEVLKTLRSKSSVFPKQKIV